jgi:hypothetical protein
MMIMITMMIIIILSTSRGNCLPTFRDNVSVPSSRVKSPSRKEIFPHDAA